jgi:hypothetical protein
MRSTGTKPAAIAPQGLGDDFNGVIAVDDLHLKNLRRLVVGSLGPRGTCDGYCRGAEHVNVLRALHDRLRRGTAPPKCRYVRMMR